MDKKSVISEYFAAIGQKGGRAKVPKGFAAMTKEQRDEVCAKSLATRKKSAKKKAAAKKGTEQRG